jgi:hypothetical protein
VESGYYPKSPNAITYDRANTLFYSGEAAMLPVGSMARVGDRSGCPGF